MDPLDKATSPNRPDPPSPQQPPEDTEVVIGDCAVTVDGTRSSWIPKELWISDAAGRSSSNAQTNQTGQRFHDLAGTCLDLPVPKLTDSGTGFKHHGLVQGPTAPPRRRSPQHVLGSSPGGISANVVLGSRPQYLDLMDKSVSFNDEHVKHCIVTTKRVDTPFFVNKKDSWLLVTKTRQSLDQMIIVVTRNSEGHNYNLQTRSRRKIFPTSS